MSDRTSMLLDADDDRTAAARETRVCLDWEDVLSGLAPIWIQGREITGAFVRVSSAGTGTHLCLRCLDAREHPGPVTALRNRNKPDANGVGGHLIYRVRLSDYDCCIGGWSSEESERLSCAECAEWLTL